MNENNIRQSAGDRIFDAVNITLLTVFLLIVLYPCIYVVSASISSVRAISSGQVVLWPVGFSLRGYQAVFENSAVWTGYKNSLIYAVLGTAINIFMTLFAAYPLSRKDFSPRNFIMGLFVITMYFSGGLIPTYMLNRSLGMINTVWVMVIPGAMSVFNVILMRTYFMTSIPESLLEAAQLDGCTDFKFISRIVVPLSMPIFAVIGLFVAVGLWNGYFQAMIYLKSPELQPLQIVLRNILVLNQFDARAVKHFDPAKMESAQGMQNLLKFSLIMVASVPILMVYPFVQKYFVKGVMIGSIKG